MQKIKIETVINADVQKVWRHWNSTDSIKGWAFASDTWGCPYAENNLANGGRFLTRMAAKDGSSAFDFTGTYTTIEEYKYIHYLMDAAEDEHEQRACATTFTDLGNGTTKIEQAFDSEDTNSVEMQQAGWTAILENFAKFVMSNESSSTT